MVRSSSLVPCSSSSPVFLGAFVVHLLRHVWFRLFVFARFLPRHRSFAYDTFARVYVLVLIRRSTWCSCPFLPRTFAFPRGTSPLLRVLSRVLSRVPLPCACLSCPPDTPRAPFRVPSRRSAAMPPDGRRAHRSISLSLSIPLLSLSIPLSQSLSSLCQSLSSLHLSLCVCVCVWVGFLSTPFHPGGWDRGGGGDGNRPRWIPFRLSVEKGNRTHHRGLPVPPHPKHRCLRKRSR